MGSSSPKTTILSRGLTPTWVKVLSDISLKEVVKGLFRIRTNYHCFALQCAGRIPICCRIEVPSGAIVQGQVLINNKSGYQLDSDLLPVDVSPYLQSGRTEVVIKGNLQSGYGLGAKSV